MRLLIFGLMFLSLCAFVSAQGVRTIRLRGASFGKVSVARGNLRSTIDLSRETTGCVYVSGKNKRDLDKKSCAAPPATFKLIDATVKNNRTFLVVASDATGNCNVCGHCGASESFALIWLELDARLRLVDKQSVAVDDCATEISSKQVKHDENDNLSSFSPAFKREILTVEFEKTIFDDNSAVSGYEFSRLEYNRKTPEKGFVVKTEKRENSSIGER